ncbi:riboflavin synthase subunit alpha [Alkalispirochaeta sphaeroplastigenens]|uniref:Riboflavin synthase n=1 Tax=Alkalispirochaeta sphaeroplastigenens TaxID=1187066 RepID=A0A2S4JP44_9SPIO|nr:riboflavin synthase [Alkalispirochaeta sphaeroplastigenens]POR01307.1 riboflavin synthase subunit alpha [Alkalispirochaeta sphaeroplastigenens]
MFTGLVEETGQVCQVVRRGDYQRLQVRASAVLQGMARGDSIAVNGVCQTVTDLEGDTFTVETLKVSLDKTTLGTLGPGHRVNLERALSLSSRLGGHLVQGHVDGTAWVLESRVSGPNGFLRAGLAPDLLRYCVREGSVTIDGVSLTIAGLDQESLTVNLIPLTRETTVLGDRRAGDLVNIEVDIIGRYVERLLGGVSPGGISRDRLAAWGFGP